jgi:hypothetical protein
MHKSYLRAFRKFAFSLLQKVNESAPVKKFIYVLTAKEIQLLMRASLNKRLNMERLQRDVFKMGREFMELFRNKVKIKV